MYKNDIYILGIESSCDDTSAAVLKNNEVLSNVTASQKVHETYGGVVPELASRAHEANILPTVSHALKQAGIKKEQLTAIAYTLGPGLLGSLLVGVNFAKGLARSLNIPLIDVNHLQGHIMAHFIKEPTNQQSNPNLQKAVTPATINSDTSKIPPYPFLCLLVSGGNTQILKVNGYNKIEVLGQTIDDAAGECIDKCAKVMGLGYPGGPIIDRLARKGNPKAYTFSKPKVCNYDYSFSGLKTSFLYNLRKWVNTDSNFIEKHKNDLAASIENTVVEILMKKLLMASKQTGITDVALSGGVSANTCLRNAFKTYSIKYNWNIYIPPFSYTTDNGAMIGIVGYYKYLNNDYQQIGSKALSSLPFTKVSY